MPAFDEGSRGRTRSVQVRGGALCDARRRLGWTQAEAARRSGLSDRLIRTAERGGPIDRQSAETLSKLLAIPLDALLAGRPPGTRLPMTERAREFLEQIWNFRNFSVIQTHLLPEFTFRHESGVACGRDEMRERIEVFQQAFSDFHFVVEESVEYDDFVVCRWVVDMTHSGPWLDLAPTGKRATVNGSSWVKVVNGMFGDAWDYWDAGRLYETLKAAS